MASEIPQLGEILTNLAETIETRKGAGADTSYTASLLAGGPEKCAKKFGEEAVEAAIAGALADKAHLAEEAADTLYHLMVLMASVGVTPEEVAALLKERTKQSGHEEKAGRQG